MAEEQKTETETVTGPVTAANPPSPPGNWKKLAVGMVPVVPVSFSKSPVYATSRVAIYGGASALLWKSNRGAARLMLGAAALSMATSLFAEWQQ